MMDEHGGPASRPPCFQHLWDGGPQIAGARRSRKRLHDGGDAAAGMWVTEGGKLHASPLSWNFDTGNWLVTSGEAKSSKSDEKGGERILSARRVLWS